MEVTVDRLLTEARAAFLAEDFDDPAQEARILVGGLLGLTSTQMISRGGECVAPGTAELVRAAVRRRILREPVHRILGVREFYGLALALSPGTLEPRPDTETLVDAMLPHARDVVRRTGRCRILDLGTGTGAICLALLDAVPEATGTGVDLSTDALATATANAARHGLGERFLALHSDWFETVEGLFDIIVSNPPYIASAVMAGLDPEVLLHDPAGALDGGPDGLDAYRIIARKCRAFLAEGGVLGLEIGFDQKVSVGGLFEAEGFTIEASLTDLGGRDRVLVFSSIR